MVVLLVALLSGALSVLTPCVLPLLPAILASSASGGRRRPIGIVVGLVISFTLALLAFSWLVDALGIPSDTLRWIAAALLLGFGLVLVAPPLERRFEALASRAARLAPGGRFQGDGFWSGVAVGGGLGIAWAPCVGPILGGVAVASATGTTTGQDVARAIAFSLGMSIPLLAIVLGGRRVAARMRTRVNPRAVQLTAGVVLLATGAMIAGGLDTKVNGWLSRSTGISSTLVADLEQDALDHSSSSSDDGALEVVHKGSGDELDDYGPAPKIAGITHWFNTPGDRPLTEKDLKGKVVLVDFWTYSCINCLRTLPYVKSWYSSYAKDGLVVIGVHAPEFEFEHDEGNVRTAIREHDIEYPVAMDNDFITWNAFQNQYWPAKYLIDRDGRVRYVHFGEGDYDQTEEAIRSLLGLGESGMHANPTPDDNLAQTQETYLGYERAQHFAGGATSHDTQATYAAPKASTLDDGEWALDGQWTVEGERIVAGTGASIVMHYRAGDVHLVLGPTTKAATGATIHVNDGERGSNGSDATQPIDEQRLYTLRSSDTLADSTIRIDVPEGVAAYAFTFG